MPDVDTGAGAESGTATSTGAVDVAATRKAYDAVAEDYAELLRDELAKKPYDRAMLAAFAELVRAGGDEPLVADLGCGPGRITAQLNQLGLNAFGLDLSPRMIAVARRTHPTLAFDVGSMEATSLPSGALTGVVAWYSIIHTPPERLPVVFSEFARVLVPRGLALLAFQSPSAGARGSRVEQRHLAHAYGHDIDLDAYRLSADGIGELLRDAGFAVEATLIREPDEAERTPQAFLLARRP